MSSKFYVLVNPESSDAFIVYDDDVTAPKPFETEAEARTEAKGYDDDSLVLQSVTSVTKTTTYKAKSLL